MLWELILTIVGIGWCVFPFLVWHSPWLARSSGGKETQESVEGSSHLPILDSVM